VNAKPVLALTLGDVAGIGPEITAKTLLGHPDLRNECVPVVVGDADAMRRGVLATGGDPSAVVVIDEPGAATNDPARIELVQAGPSLRAAPVGEISALAGDAAYRFVVEACSLAKSGKVSGIVTAPLNKAAMHAGGHKWPGHTELLAHEFGVTNFSLVLSAGDLYVFHLTTHLSLSDAIANITPARCDALLDLAGGFARALDWANEPIGLAGLNPHAGEGGLFGSEEIEILSPAVAGAPARRVKVVGPRPPDPQIAAAGRGKRRVQVVCYHDHGHSPVNAG
jgi:4-hydroxythreonine-4-phosphate dehydrogenase